MPKTKSLLSEGPVLQTQAVWKMDYISKQSEGLTAGYFPPYCLYAILYLIYHNHMAFFISNIHIDIVYEYFTTSTWTIYRLEFHIKYTSTHVVICVCLVGE